MTVSSRDSRTSTAAFQTGERWILLLLLVIAGAMRLTGVGFGLPALNDPDEPLFVMTALELLRNRSFNPGWFGHPGTTTIYALALIDLAVAATALASGRFEGADGFVKAIYADPGIVVLPGRLFIVACGVVCVWLTWWLGKRLSGPRIALIGALFLAVNAVHIEYSQLIRTDMNVSVFMLLCVGAAIQIARTGRRRYYLLAGLFVGLACATKWPGAAIAICPVAASILRMAEDRVARARHLRLLVLFAAASVASLILSSPYLLLDYPTVLQNLEGEARPWHPGATGRGFFGNLAWYVGNPLAASIGWIGLALAAIGGIAACVRSREFRFVMLPGFLTFLAMICAQSLIWERWLVPLLPFIAIMMAFGLVEVANGMRRLIAVPLPQLELAAAALLALPMAQAARVEARERSNDTRQMASAWIRANVPAGRTVLIEDAMFDLMDGRRKLLFPLGAAGCLDVDGLLSGKVRYSRVERVRVGKPIVDLGNVDPARLATCHADYAVLTHFDRYAAEPEHFNDELAQYRRYIQGGTTIATWRPIQGRSSGPRIVIVQFAR